MTLAFNNHDLFFVSVKTLYCGTQNLTTSEWFNNEKHSEELDFVLKRQALHTSQLTQDLIDKAKESVVHN